MTRCWNITISAATGTMPTTNAAEITGHGKENSPWYSVMPTGSVRISLVDVNERANRNSCQVTMRTNTAVATMPYRNSASGSQSITMYIYATTVAVDPTKTVESVVLPNVNSTDSGTAMHLFALALGS